MSSPASIGGGAKKSSLRHIAPRPRNHLSPSSRSDYTYTKKASLEIEQRDQPAGNSGLHIRHLPPTPGIVGCINAICSTLVLHHLSARRTVGCIFYDPCEEQIFLNQELKDLHRELQIGMCAWASPSNGEISPQFSWSHAAVTPSFYGARHRELKDPDGSQSWFPASLALPVASPATPQGVIRPTSGLSCSSIYNDKRLVVQPQEQYFYDDAPQGSYGVTVAPSSYGARVAPSSYGAAISQGSYGATVAPSSYGAVDIDATLSPGKAPEPQMSTSIQSFDKIFESLSQKLDLLLLYMSNKDPDGSQSWFPASLALPVASPATPQGVIRPTSGLSCSSIYNDKRLVVQPQEQIPIDDAISAIFQKFEDERMDTVQRLEDDRRTYLAEFVLQDDTSNGTSRILGSPSQSLAPLSNNSNPTLITQEDSSNKEGPQFDAQHLTTILGAPRRNVEDPFYAQRDNKASKVILEELCRLRFDLHFSPLKPSTRFTTIDTKPSPWTICVFDPGGLNVVATFWIAGIVQQKLHEDTCLTDQDTYSTQPLFSIQVELTF